MLLNRVEYARPKTVAEAIGLLGSRPNARPLAGGQSLLNVMKVRAAAPDLLVDLADLEELRTISRGGDGSLELGAMVTYADAIGSADVSAARPILGEVCSQIADVQVRNRGTIGGNACMSDPTNHLPPLLVALGASFTVEGAGGAREVPAGEFFLGVYFTAVGEGELLTKITIPAKTGKDGFASITIGKEGTCIVNAAASLNGDMRIAIGCVSATPVVVSSTDAVADAVKDAPADVHASAEYRRHLADVLVRRAVEGAK
jgi:aerobic carbon-monoxide dehydrogenase medium subunit